MIIYFFFVLEIDECKSLLPYPCTKPHELCKNNIGPGIMCVCQTGYQRVGTICKGKVLKNKFRYLYMNVSTCPSGERCIDDKTGFECLCAAGYVKNDIGQCEGTLIKKIYF